MPSTNKTPVLNLNQWVGTDYPQMDDFNSDNLILDTKLTLLDATLSSATPNAPTYFEASGINNVYTITTTTGTTSISSGFAFNVKFLNDSTDAIKIQFDSLTPIECLKFDRTKLYDVKTDNIYSFVYDGTNFVSQNGDYLVNNKSIVEVDSLSPDLVGSRVADTNAWNGTAITGSVGSSGVGTSTTLDGVVSTNSGQQLFANNGSKIVRLSNGWLVCASINSTATQMAFSKSIDNGITWTGLCYNNDSFNAGTYCLTSFNNNVVCVYTNAVSPSHSCKSICFDATTITSYSPLGHTHLIATLTIPITGVSVTCDSTGKFHMVYCKTDVGVGSSTIQYLTLDNISASWVDKGVAYTITPSSSAQLGNIVCDSSNKPIIFFKTFTTTKNLIQCIKYNGTSWTLTPNISDTGTYTSTKPYGLIDNSGSLYVVWGGSDATYSTVGNIKCRKSTNGGSSWIDFGITNQYITTGSTLLQSSPMIVNDSLNNIYVIWYGQITSGGNYVIRYTKHNGTSWSSIIDYPTTSPAFGYTNPSILINYKNFTEPVYIYKSGSNGIKIKGVLGSASTSINSLVVNVNYDLINANTHKFVRMDNGILILALADTSTKKIHFYKSDNNGVNWIPITYISYISNGYAIATYNNKISVIYNGISNQVNFVNFDPSTTPVIAVPSIISSTSTGLSNGMSITYDKLGYLHATWCSNPLPTSGGGITSGIFYAKSINNGSSWITSGSAFASGTVSTSFENPHIVCNTNNFPHVIVYFNPYLRMFAYDGSTWNNIMQFNFTGYTLDSYCFTIDSSNNKYVVYSATDSIYPSAKNIICKKQTSTGSTWNNLGISSSNGYITTENTRNQVDVRAICDNDDNIYIGWRGASVTSPSVSLVRTIKYNKNTSSWESISEYGHTSGVANYFYTFLSNYKNFIEPMYIYKTGTSIRVKGILGSSTSSSTSPVELASYKCNNLRFGNYYAELRLMCSNNTSTSDAITIKIEKKTGASTYTTLITRNIKCNEFATANVYQSFYFGFNYNSPKAIDNELKITATLQPLTAPYTVQLDDILIYPNSKVVSATITDADAPVAFTPTATANSSTEITVSGTTTDTGVGLDASPYDFSTDGTTWLGYQASGTKIFSGLQPNKQYSFYMRARDKKGNTYTIPSAISKFTLANIPTWSTNSVTSNSATLSWTANGNLGTPYYEVEMDSGTGYVNKYSGTGLTTTISGLNANTTYKFRIRSQNGDGVYSTYSAELSLKTSTVATDTTPPSISFSLSALSTTSIRASITANDSGLGLHTTPYDFSKGGTSFVGYQSSNYYDFTGLSPGTQYTFVCKARDSAIPPNEATASAKTLYTLPNAPVSLTASGGTGQISLNWVATNGSGTTYTLEVADPASGIWSPITGITGTSYTHSVSGSAVTKSYRVKAVNGNGVSSTYSNIVNATTAIVITDGTPPTITSFNATVNSASSITVSASATDTGSPPVQYSFSKDNGSIWTSYSSTSSYTFNTLASNTLYTLKVKAKDASNNETVYTSSLTRTTHANVPTNLIITNTTNNRIDVAWTPNNPIGTIFRVDSAMDSAFSGAISYSEGSGTSNYWTGLYPNTIYYFRVRAKNNDGINTSYTSTVSKYTLCNPAINITSFVGGGASDWAIHLFWDKNSNPTGTQYEVSSPDGFGGISKKIVNNNSLSIFKSDTWLNTNPPVYKFTITPINYNGIRATSTDSSLIYVPT